MEENLLFNRTFMILGGMLVLTTISSRFNKAYETKTEFFITVGGTFLSLFVIYFLGDQFPANIFAVCVFSLFIGWSLGPTIASIGEKFKFRKFLKDKMVLSKTITTKKTTFTDRLIGKEDEKKTVYFFKSDPEKTFDRMSNEFRELKLDFEKNVLPHDRYNQEWQNIVFQALIGTTLAVLLTATIVVFTDNDFGFLGPILLICLIALVIMEFLNAFFFKSRRRRLVQAYFGVVLFTLYLIYDFNRLEKAIARGDDSWSTAIDIAVNIYLDLINLFIDLLEILASSE
ncbi:MAG: Bax inhibitor-1 family protein [Bacteroidota bacterium]|nr:Bax inhibitor-1 family protein [Bacteroidota bacterium]MEE2604829.1 Bax inhibitor-1 family protein [Bacteroidota bacterium]